VVSNLGDLRSGLSGPGIALPVGSGNEGEY
jgi:hypothetical protein